MAAADEAYWIAERLVEEARESGEERLSLDHEDCRALDRLPVGIAGLTGLTELSLNRTQVSDLSPLRELTGLTRLSLDGTQVSDLSPLRELTGLTGLLLDGTQVSDLSPLHELTGLAQLSINGIPAADLRPLRKLTRLATEPDVRGLTFKDTGATRIDPRIGEIAEIGDKAERARVLFDYLEGWEPPVPALPPADRPDVPAYELPDKGPMRSLDPALGPATEEQEELRQDLVGKANRLIAAIGQSNELADLRGIAEHYLGRISRPLPDIRLQSLYSAANALRTAYEANEQAEREGRLNDILPPKIAGAVKDIVEVHALFFMGFPEAAAIHERILSGLTGRREKESYEDEEKIVQSLKDSPSVLDPVDLEALEDDLAAAKGAGPSAEIGARRLKGRLWNMLGAGGRWVFARGKWGGSAVIGHDFIAWLIGNQTVIGKWLEWAQGPGAVWFRRVIEMLTGPG